MPANEADRAYLESMRMLTRDDQGREVLVGLTLDETEWYFAYVESNRAGSAMSANPFPKEDANRDRYIELHDRHELARLRIVLAEVDARRDPIRN